MTQSRDDIPAWRKRAAPIALVAAVVGGAAVYLFMRPSVDVYSTKSMGENVTLRDAETGDEWQMNRGLMMQELMLRANAKRLNEKEGIVNPKTGKPNGFPVNREWEKTIEQIRADIAAFEASRKTR